MRGLTDEWVSKAENDFALANLALYSSAEPILDGACFHCQQCAEKYLKAFLQEHEIEFPRQHPLIPLLELCMTVDKSFKSLRDDLEKLDGFSVAIRYPGASVSLGIAEEAISAAGRVRKFIRKKLKLR